MAETFDNISYNYIVSSCIYETCTCGRCRYIIKTNYRIICRISGCTRRSYAKIVLGINESLFEIKDGNTSFWANFIIIGLFIVGTALAIVTAIPSGGSSVGVWAAFAISAGAKIAISIGAYTLVGELLTTLTAEMLADTYYLPQYELSPYEIFADKITVLDIDFLIQKKIKL